MTKADLITVIADKLRFPWARAELLVDVVFDCMEQSISRGEKDRNSTIPCGNQPGSEQGGNQPGSEQGGRCTYSCTRETPEYSGSQLGRRSEWPRVVHS